MKIDRANTSVFRGTSEKLNPFNGSRSLRISSVGVFLIASGVAVYLWNNRISQENCKINYDRVQKVPDKLILEDETIFESNCGNGIPQGLLKMVFKDGTYFEGNMLNGLPYGFCKMIDKDGAILEGNFVDGVLSGPYTHTTLGGKVTKGKYVNGKPEIADPLTNLSVLARDFVFSPIGAGVVAFSVSAVVFSLFER